MTRDEFVSKLKENSIDPNIVSFNDDTKEGYCIRKNYFRWETLVRERGKEYDIIGYPSESDALNKMYLELLKLYGCRTQGDDFGYTCNDSAKTGDG